MKTHQFHPGVIQLVGALFLLSGLSANASTCTPPHRKEPDPSIPKIPHEYANISISAVVGAPLVGDSGGKYTAPPKPFGGITVGVTSTVAPYVGPAEPIVAGDAAPNEANRWIQTTPAKGSKVKKPKSVAFTCSNGRRVSEGQYGFKADVGMNPASGWTPDPPIVIVSGGIVIWNGDQKGGTIYVPRLKYQVDILAPIHQDLSDEDAEAALWRTDIGVTEDGSLKVEFAPPGPVTWAADDNIRLWTPGWKGPADDYTAYIDAGSSNVTATLDDYGWTGSVTFTVFEPTSVAYKWESEIPNGIPSERAFAGMYMTIDIEPASVSFRNNKFLEADDFPDGAPSEVPNSSSPTTATGPFDVTTAEFWHNAGEGWIQPRIDNRLEYTDEASGGILLSRVGLTLSCQLEWKIPCLWKSLKFSMPTLWRQFDTVTQTFTFTSPDVIRVVKDGEPNRP